MIDPKTIHGKKLALIAWGKDKDGEDDVAVFTGTANWRNGRLIMVRDEGKTEVPILDEWLARIKMVTPDLKEVLLNADCSISLSIGDLAEVESSERFIKTELKWPSGKD